MVHHSYGYRYLETPRPELLRLNSIGRQSVMEASYSWDGRKREGDGFIFKYTLSGEGRLTVNQQTYKLTKGQAFFVAVPSLHHYDYDPSMNEPWEFIWIRVSGVQVAALWKEWMATEGPVSEFHSDSETIVKLHSLYESAAAGALGDMWDISVQLYDWLLTLMKRQTHGKVIQQPIPDSYSQVVAWIESNYADDISLDQLADMIGVTKHHFCKKFQDHYRTTPIQYLRKIRIEAAASLLRQSQLPVKDIAERCGFSDLGYFGKVFHHYAGFSPSAYRMLTVDHGNALKLL